MAKTLILTEAERKQNLRNDLRLARGYLLDAVTEAEALKDWDWYVGLRLLVDQLDKRLAKL